MDGLVFLFTFTFTSFMASEDTALLSTSDDDVYLRFSSTRKSIILAMVSACTMINCTAFISICAFYGLMYDSLDSLIELFTPSIPQIAKDLNSTGAVVK